MAFMAKNTARQKQKYSHLQLYEYPELIKSILWTYGVSHTQQACNWNDQKNMVELTTMFLLSPQAQLLA